MTDLELLSLIDSDALASQCVAVGDDSGAATRLSQIAPLVRVSKVLTERGVLDELGAMEGDLFLKQLEQFAVANHPLASVVARAVKLLEPSNGGLDFGNHDFLAMVGMLAQAGIFTVEQKAAIDALSLVKQVIEPSQVSMAMLTRRPDGKVSNA